MGERWVVVDTKSGTLSIVRAGVFGLLRSKSGLLRGTPGERSSVQGVEHVDAVREEREREGKGVKKGGREDWGQSRRRVKRGRKERKEGRKEDMSLRSSPIDTSVGLRGR